jgi:hypothetical protein
MEEEEVEEEEIQQEEAIGQQQELEYEEGSPQRNSRRNGRQGGTVEGHPLGTPARSLWMGSTPLTAFRALLPYILFSRSTIALTSWNG